MIHALCESTVWRQQELRDEINTQAQRKSDRDQCLNQHCQRSFRLKQRGANTETLNWTTMHRVRGFGTLSPKCFAVFKSLPSRFRELCGRRGGKIVRAGKVGGHQRNSDFRPKPGAHMNSQRLWQYTQELHRVKTDRITERGLPSLTKKLSPINICFQRKR